MSKQSEHEQSFFDALDAFKDAEDRHVASMRSGNCSAAHTAWTQMGYYEGILSAEADAMTDADAKTRCEREVRMAERTLEAITKKFRSCVKAI